MSTQDDEKDISDSVPRFLDDVELVERKRVKLDSFGRKRWSLTDRQKDQEVLEEMGVGVLDMEEDNAEYERVVEKLHSSKGQTAATRSSRGIENENPNVSHRAAAVGSPRSKNSPRSAGSAHGGGRSRREGDAASHESHFHHNPPPIQEPAHWSSSANLDVLLSSSGPDEAPPASCEAAEEAPSPTTCSVQSCEWPVSAGSSACGHLPGSTEIEEQTPKLDTSAVQMAEGAGGGESSDSFSVLSDEVMLSIFKWLPKQTLVLCMLVCRRWHRVACDESFWQRLELGNRVVARDALGLVLARKPYVLRLAASEVGDWHTADTCSESVRLQYLDLSMTIVDVQTLNALLDRCPNLKKLSLENVPINEETCFIMGRCTRMETLNMTMTQGITPNGMAAVLQGCSSIQSLNISWTLLCVEGMRVVCQNAPVRIQRLNVAGCRRTLTDDMLATLCTRCPRLQELDISDCSQLTGKSLLIVASRLTRLEHLALSRCYSMPPQSMTRAGSMSSLQYLDVWGLFTDASLEALKAAMPAIHINHFMHSAIARPTVGNRRTSIWGLRTRD